MQGGLGRLPITGAILGDAERAPAETILWLRLDGLLGQHKRVAIVLLRFIRAVFRAQHFCQFVVTGRQPLAKPSIIRRVREHLLADVDGVSISLFRIIQTAELSHQAANIPVAEALFPAVVVVLRKLGRQLFKHGQGPAIALFHLVWPTQVRGRFG